MSTSITTCLTNLTTVVDDSLLYIYFVEALSLLSLEDIDSGHTSKAIETVTADFESKHPDDRDRLEKVLHIMLTAFPVSRFMRSAETLLSQLD